MSILLREYVDMDRVSVLTEDTPTDNGQTKKHYKLKGVFLQGAIKNKNGRTYPTVVLEREVKNYQDLIKIGKSCGTLDHQDGPDISLERISHVCENLTMNGDDGVGILRLIDSPCGLVAQTLVKENIPLGVSTRGVGSLGDDNIVKDDFNLLSIDLVFSNSAPKAVVEAVLENKNHLMNNEATEIAVKELKEQVDKSYSSISSQAALKYLNTFINKIRKGNSK